MTRQVTPPRSWLRDPSLVPTPSKLRELVVAAALLDSILEPRPEDRPCLFDEAWGRNEELATLRNGEGDFAFIWFGPEGTVIRGFDHESAMSPIRQEPPGPWEGLFDGLPTVLAYANEEPAFALEEVTFCLWRLRRGRKWRTGSSRLPRGDDPDGSGRLFAVLAGGPGPYRRDAVKRIGRDLSADALNAIYDGHIDADIISSLNPDADIAAILRRAERLGLRAAQPSGARPVTTKPTKNRPAKKRSKKTGKGQRKSGRAEFTIETSDGEVRMLVNGRAIATSSGDPQRLYNALFDQAKLLIEEP